MRNRTLTREEALQEYLIYRKRIREFLDIAHISSDIKGHKYKPRDLLGRGPERFSETLRDILTGLFSSLCDPSSSSLNIFDVWLVLFPEKKDKISKTWEEVKPHFGLVRDYRNDVVAHANKNLQRYVNTRLRFYEKRQEIIESLKKFLGLAAELMRDEAKTLPHLSTEVAPILEKSFPSLNSEKTQLLIDYFLGGGEADNRS